MEKGGNNIVMKNATAVPSYIFYVTNGPLSATASAFVLLIYYSIVFERRGPHKSSYAFGRPTAKFWGPFKLIPCLLFSTTAKSVFYVFDGLKYLHCANNEIKHCIVKLNIATSCRLRGAIRLVFQESVLIFVVCVAYDLYSIVVNRKRLKVSMYMFIGYAVPTLFGVIAYVCNLSGATNSLKCWLKNDDGIGRI